MLLIRRGCMFYRLKKKIREEKYNRKRDRYIKKGNGKIYFDVRHMDYWWGIYGLRELTNWEDVLIYSKVGSKYEKLGYFCISAESFVKSSLEDTCEESEFIDEVRLFLEGNDTYCHYYYDSKCYGEIYEVPHKTPLSDEGLKASSIEMWVKDEGVGLDTIEKCIDIYMKEFLNIEYEEIIYKDQVSLKNSLESLFEELDDFNESKEVYFSEGVIKQMSRKMNLSRLEVEKILNIKKD
jgi:hypothetical protein